MKAKRHLFILPDGSTLKFAPYWQAGSQSDWFYSFDDVRVWEASLNEKGKQYRVNLWSSNTHLYVIAADCDRLPEGFHSFDALYEYFRLIFDKNSAIVARSASGKAKLFFLIEMPSEIIDMNTQIAIDTLEKIFAFDLSLFESLDLTPSSLRISYLNESVLKALSENLPLLLPISGVLPEGPRGVITNTTRSNSKPYRLYEGPIPDSLPKLRGAGEEFQRILLASPGLLTPSYFGIPTPTIANQLNVTQQMIWRYRNRFERKGLLAVASNRHFVPGKKAIRFQAAGALEVALRKLYSRANEKVELPASIPDGQWHRTLGTLIRLLSLSFTLDEVLAQVRTIDGAHVGTRMKQARGWYLWWKKKRSPTNSKSACGVDLKTLYVPVQTKKHGVQK
jgi:hypothetical protein